MSFFRRPNDPKQELTKQEEELNNCERVLVNLRMIADEECRRERHEYYFLKDLRKCEKASKETIAQAQQCLNIIRRGP